MSGDTTEAMRAARHRAIMALLAIDQARPFGSPAIGDKQKIVDAVIGALATPAAPAVTDSAHTGAVPDKWIFDPHDIEQGMMLNPAWLAQNTHLTPAQAAAQPSPERNDREPVAWCALTAGGKIAYFDGKPIVMPGPVGNRSHPTPLYTAPPPPAERHYCERCGKRLGHTKGVHTCTPPEDDADGWRPIESAPLDGTHILAYWRAEAFGESDGRNYGIVWFQSGSWVDSLFDPTALNDPDGWQHLPPPPAAVTKEPQQ